MLLPAEIKKMRERLGESQTEFANRFGVNQSTVHRWETEGLPSAGAARMAVEKFAAAMIQLGTPQSATS